MLRATPERFRFDVRGPPFPPGPFPSHLRNRPLRTTWIVSALSISLVLAQAGSMTFPALMPTLMVEWDLSESDAGWIAGMFFAGYALAVPFLSTLGDRMDARPVVIAAALVTGVSVFAFAFWVEDLWAAMLMRFLSGIGIAGVHMPGLGLLAERLTGAARARGSAIYAACYALGTAGSFLIAGAVSAAFDWRAAFVVSGLAPILVVPLIAAIGPPLHPRKAPDEAKPTAMLDFRPVLRNRNALAYIVAYAGNTWEVFGVRTWFVAFVAFSVTWSGYDGAGWNAAVLSAIAAFVGVPAGIAVAELAVRRNRRVVIAATAGVSVLVALVIAVLVEAPAPLLVALLMLHGVTSYGDAPSISSGVVEAADEGRRGATLAVFALAGFIPGFVAPLVIGIVLEAAGGLGSPDAWRLAFVVIALGSVVSMLAMRIARPPARTE